MRKMMTALVTFPLLAAIACGGSMMTAPSAPEPDPYAAMMAHLDAAGRPQRWEGGPMRHCFDASVAAYREQFEAVADRLAIVSGIPRTEAGPCNVVWVQGQPDAGKSATTYAAGTDNAITRATVVMLDPGDLARVRPAAILHEGGHVLGLRHSDHTLDVMNPNVNVRDFSADERGILAWMYR